MQWKKLRLIWALFNGLYWRFWGSRTAINFTHHFFFALGLKMAKSQTEFLEWVWCRWAASGRSGPSRSSAAWRPAPNYARIRSKSAHSQKVVASFERRRQTRVQNPRISGLWLANSNYAKDWFRTLHQTQRGSRKTALSARFWLDHIRWRRDSRAFLTQSGNARLSEWTFAFWRGFAGRYKHRTIRQQCRPRTFLCRHFKTKCLKFEKIWSSQDVVISSKNFCRKLLQGMFLKPIFEDTYFRVKMTL